MKAHFSVLSGAAWAKWSLLGLLVALGAAACKDTEPVSGGGDDEENNASAECEGDGDCEGGERCVDSACVVVDPACGSDDDCQGGQTCQDGVCVTLGCSSDAQCAQGERCVDSACVVVDVSCTPEEARCEGSTRVVCEGGVLRELPCGEAEACELQGGEAVCVPAEACEDGQGCVDGATAWVCEDGVRREVACGEGQTCQDGVCAGGFECAPFEIGCLDAVTAYACDDVGAVTPLPCREGQVCQDAACVALVCEPNAQVCDGDLLLTCSADGLSQVEQDCAQGEGCEDNPNGCACVEGACVALACEPDERRCVGNAAQACDAFGTAWLGLEACAEDELCLGGECVAAECAPGGRRCVGDVLLVCSAQGVLQEDEDCAAGALLCDPVEERCVPRLCEPAARTCDGELVMKCDDRGASLTVQEDCAASGLFCVEGACVEQCRPGEQRCEGAVSVTCDPQRLQPVEENCAADGLICLPGGCAPPVCEAGEPACDGTVATACNADGTGFEPGGEDCADLGQNCRAGECFEGEDLCPTTVARAGSTAAQVPLATGTVVVPAAATLLLDGRQSSDDDAVARVEWRQISGPNVPTISAQADARNASVTGLAPEGRYVFEATAYDSAGQPSCQPQTVEVFTVGPEDAVVHLLWSNALDSNPLDDNGSDVDLHVLYAQQSGWFDQLDDLHYANRDAAWGGTTGALRLDDLNGRGPEIVVLDNLAQCQWFHVGLDYYEPRSLGQALVDVRLFLGGELAYEALGEPMNNRREWLDVLAFQWPSREVFSVLELRATTPQGVRPSYSEEMLDSGLCGIPEDVLPPDCDDALGDLSSLALAAPLASGPYEGLYTCEAQPDHFSVTATGASTLVLEAQEFYGDGLYLEVLGSAGQAFAVQTRFDQPFLVPLQSAGTYYARTSGPNGLVGYDLDGWVCAPDRYAPNTSTQTAPLLTAGTYNDLTFCGGPGRFFAVQVNAGQQLDVVMNRERGGTYNFINVDILNPSLQSVVVGQPNGLTTTASTGTVVTGGRYYVRLSSPNAQLDTNELSMTIQVSTLPSRADLTNQSFGTTGTATAGQSLRLTSQIRNLGGAAGPFRNGYYFSVNSTYDANDVFLGEDIVDSLAGLSVSTRDVDVIIPTTPLVGSAYLCQVIDRSNQVTESNESNNNTCFLVNVARVCSDFYEPNNVGAQAPELAPGTYTNLTSCSGDGNDFFELCPEQGDAVDVSVSFAHSSGNLDLELYDADTGALLGSSRTTGNAESVSLDEFTGGGCLWARVFSPNPSQNTYSLTYAVTTPDPCESQWEPNRTIDEAVATGADLFALAEEEDIELCPAADIDTFYADMAPGTYTACAFNSPLNGEDYELMLEILNPSRSRIRLAQGTTACATFTVTTAGRFYVRASSPSAVAPIYFNLTLDAQ